MRGRAGWMWWLGMVGLGWSWLGAAAHATNFLDGQRRLVWSPDGRWVVFNWPLRPELFVVEIATGRAYRLQPVGDYRPEAGIVVAPDASGSSDGRGRMRAAIGIPSPGTGKLTWEEWSPDSRFFLFRYGKNQLAIYGVDERRVTELLAPPARPPWVDAAELTVEFESRRATEDVPAAVILRVRRASGEPVKEIAFTQITEMGHINAMRFRPITFLSHRRDFVLFPQRTEAGWHLMRASLTHAEPPSPLGAATAEPPYEWKLSADDEGLVVVERNRVVWGSVRDWANARTHPYSGAAVTAAWSDSGRYLAWQTKQSLYVCHRDHPAPKRVSDECAPRFWGWRGERLVFGHSRDSRANLYEVEPETGEVRPVLKAHPWQAAPQEISLSPRGDRLACLVHQFDGNGVGFWELWVAPVRPDATWELIFTWRS